MTTKSWSAYDNVWGRVEQEYGKGATEALRKHLGGNFANGTKLKFEDTVKGVDDYEGTQKWHMSVVENNVGFLNEYAGKNRYEPLRLTGGLTQNPSDSAGSVSVVPSRGSVFVSQPSFSTGTSKRRGSLFNTSTTSLFGN